nr:hemerythrin domain-containing protein [Micromonospora sp. DSM 115978]
GWPLIVASAAASQVTVDLMPLTDDHEAMESSLGRLEAAVARFTSDAADTAARTEFAEAAARIRDLLHDHVVAEEPVVFPLLTEYVSVADYKRWEKVADAGVPIRELAQIIPSTARAVDHGYGCPRRGRSPVVTRAEARTPFAAHRN